MQPGMTVFEIRVTFHCHECEKNLTGTILNLQASFIFQNARN